MEEYNIGDTVYYAIGTGTLEKGTIVHIARIPGYGYEHYIVESPSHIEPILVVREWDTLSSTKKGPLNYMKQLRNKS